MFPQPENLAFPSKNQTEPDKLNWTVLLNGIVGLKCIESIFRHEMVYAYN